MSETGTEIPAFLETLVEAAFSAMGAEHTGTQAEIEEESEKLTAALTTATRTVRKLVAHGSSVCVGYRPTVEPRAPDYANADLVMESFIADELVEE